jgi:hypothetical protein
MAIDDVILGTPFLISHTANTGETFVEREIRARATP